MRNTETKLRKREDVTDNDMEGNRAVRQIGGLEFE